MNDTWIDVEDDYGKLFKASVIEHCFDNLPHVHLAIRQNGDFVLLYEGFGGRWYISMYNSE